MNTPSPSPSVEASVRCWCGCAQLEDFSPDYWRCPACQTLVLRAMRGEEISQVRDDEHDFYGKNYYLHHVQEDYGLPDLETRARADLPERGLHWLRTLLKFVPGPGARTLELGCGHGGFVALQRWAGLDATGLELSPWVVEQARRWFDVPVLEGRLEDQQLAPASYDAVVLMDVLEHLPDPRRTLGQAAALLRAPHGFLLIQTPCYPAGLSYETLCAQNHPFLQQLKPKEHLYLFSEQAVARLCAELGVGQVRFEPAIYAHYDLFAVASAAPLAERPLPEQAASLLSATPPARAALALLDLGHERDDIDRRLRVSVSEATGLRETADHRGAEVTRLHAEVDRWLRETKNLWPRLNDAENARNLLTAQLADARHQFTGLEAVAANHAQEITRLCAQLDLVVNERNLLASQLAELHGHFERSETDRTARLQIIANQDAEILRLSAKLDAAQNECNLRAAQLADLHGHFQGSEADRAARLEVINHQGGVIGELETRLRAADSERARVAADLGELGAQHAELGQEHTRLSTDLREARAAHRTLATDHQALQARQQRLERHWTARWLKTFGLWPR